MSWIGVILVLICIITARNGYRRGFTKTVVSMISFLIIILLASILNPMISGWIDEHTKIEEKTKIYCENVVEDVLEKEIGEEEENDLIKKLPLPDQVKTELLKNNNRVAYRVLGAVDFSDYLASFMAKMVVRAIVMIISMMAAWLIVKIGSACLESIMQMPVLGFLNRVAGFGIGLVKGCIVIWVLFLCVMIISGTGVGGFLVARIHRDCIAEWFYQWNPLVWLLLVFFVL